MKDTEGQQMKNEIQRESTDTIAAISTPYGTGGIGIIRISGPASFETAGRIFSGKRPFQEIRSHSVSHGKIVDPATGQMLDDVLIIKMKGPNTFTAEDVVEISCHGGIAVLRNVLSLVLRQGIRAADPGEFTKRAFLNGRMDLTQAEAVIDLINSKTNEGSRAAIEQLEGRLSESIRKARGELIGLIAHIEAVVDYPEHDIEDITSEQVYEGVQNVRKSIAKISESYDRGKLLREGITAAIIGRPNAGKSSLLNAITGSNRAIVTDIPGTTRDIIEEYVNIKGIPVRFLDTAGIRNTSDPVESIGVERAQAAAREAELVIVVLDAQEGIRPEEIELLSSYEMKKKIILINKTDLAQEIDILEMKKKLGASGDLPVVIASVTEGTGLEELLDTIEGLFLKGKLQTNNEVLVTNARHRQLLDRAAESLLSAENAHDRGLPLDFITIDIKESAEYLGQITGESVSEDVVKEIFSRFCVGK
jgi:tRNA modification GTPase